MNAYYEDPFCTIYCGDCRQILPDIKADVVITDPVWPTCPPGLLPGADGRQGQLLRDALSLCLMARTWVVVLGFNCDPRWLHEAVPIAKPFIRTQLLPYVLPSYVGRLLAGDEMAYSFGVVPPTNGLIPGRLTTESEPGCKRKVGHPCPRSPRHMAALIRWWTLPTDVIIDPFMGSGTTLVAGKIAGRTCIGIEIDPVYCEVAKQRLRQEMLPL
jgi:hypothetical protein